jgi:hypothetical protein
MEERNSCKESKIGGTDLEEQVIEIVGQISQEDIDNGTVLIFRINERTYPVHILKQVAESIKQAVVDTFDGKVKAIILPDTIEVTVLKDILKEHMND